MRSVTVSWQIEGREVEIEAWMAPAEADVGIMSPYPEGLRVIGEEWSQEKLEALMNDDALCTRLVEAYYGE